MVRIAPFLVVLCLFAGVPAAHGAVVLSETFAGDEPDFAATSNWVRSYCQDNWRTDLNGGVTPNRDDSCPECGCNFLVQSSADSQCLQSDPMDNHIQTGSPYWQNYRYDVTFRNSDNDTMGVVFRYVNSANFYLFLVSRQAVPGTGGCDESFVGARLIRMRYETGAAVLKSVQEFTYVQNQVHRIRVTVEGQHIQVQFDLNGNGSFGANEVFFDQDDDSDVMLPAGAVGLYAYNNGVLEADGSAAPCADGGCWFDDVQVDLLPPNNHDCGNVPWEGQCAGNMLSFCGATGWLQHEDCGTGCCGWLAAEGYYTCLPANSCSGGCVNECAPGEHGCAVNLSHQWVCGDGNDDGCLEPLFAPCDEGECSPDTGTCTAPCTPDCDGKECGDNGCGGFCGSCPEGETCSEEGHCEPKVPGKLGDPCSSAADCQGAMCVTTDEGQVCSKACSGDAGCPAGFVCGEATVNGVVLQACIPTGECVPDCSGKKCGSDGCDGDCGTCDAGFECSGGACLPSAGASCTKATDCASGLCIAFQSGTFCSTPCSTDAGCPEGWQCGPWMSATTPNICAPPVTMTAHETCAEVSECVDGCPSNPNCYANCFFLGSEQARAEYAALFGCAEAECFAVCAEAENEGCLGTCLLDACFQPYALCFPGESTCAQALDCMSACPPGDDDCSSACFQEALPAAKKQLAALLACVESECGVDPPDGCIAEALTGPCVTLYDSCTAGCEPVCDGMECGPDGCGGSCGTCPGGKLCEAGLCVTGCTPDCDNKDCGDDGCGGSCGTCLPPLVCIAGQCEQEGTCVSHAYRECVGESLYWFDSCDTQEELADPCPYGCQDAACLAPPDADVTTADGNDEPPVDEGLPVVFSAPTSSSGCTAAGPVPNALSILLLALVLLALTGCLSRRNPHA